MSIEIDTSPFDREIEQCERETRSIKKDLNDIYSLEQDARELRKMSNMSAMMQQSFPQRFDKLNELYDIQQQQLYDAQQQFGQERQESESKKGRLERLKRKYVTLVKTQVLPCLAEYDEDLQKTTIDAMTVCLQFAKRNGDSTFGYLGEMGVAKKTIDALDRIARTFALTTKTRI